MKMVDGAMVGAAPWWLSCYKMAEIRPELTCVLYLLS